MNAIKLEQIFTKEKLDHILSVKNVLKSNIFNKEKKLVRLIQIPSIIQIIRSSGLDRLKEGEWLIYLLNEEMNKKRDDKEDWLVKDIVIKASKDDIKKFIPKGNKTISIPSMGNDFEMLHMNWKIDSLYSDATCDMYSEYVKDMEEKVTDALGCPSQVFEREIMGTWVNSNESTELTADILKETYDKMIGHIPVIENAIKSPTLMISSTESTESESIKPFMACDVGFGLSQSSTQLFMGTVGIGDELDTIRVRELTEEERLEQSFIW